MFYFYVYSCDLLLEIKHTLLQLLHLSLTLTMHVLLNSEGMQLANLG